MQSVKTMTEPNPARIGTPAPLNFYVNAALQAHGQALAAAANPKSHNAFDPDAGGKTNPRDVAFASVARIGEMLSGIEKWQAHPYTRNVDDPPVIWTQHNTRLLDYGGAGPVVLVIPSLINKSYILDLMEELSFLRALRQAGLHPVLLDWGDAAPGRSITDIMQATLLPAANMLIERYGDISVLGYCMGGTMSLALTAHMPQRIQRLALLGTPWKFSESDGETGRIRDLFQRGHREMTEMFLQHSLRASPVTPSAFFQFLFAMIAPMQAIRKFRRFNEMDQDSATAKRFVAVEEWISDPVDLPSQATEELIVNWFLGDETGRGKWAPFGEAVNPKAIATPTLILTGDRDHIAPPRTSTCLADIMPHAVHTATDTGHVGLIVGSNSGATVIPALADFLQSA